MRVALMPYLTNRLPGFVIIQQGGSMYVLDTERDLVHAYFPDSFIVEKRKAAGLLRTIRADFNHFERMRLSIPELSGFKFGPDYVSESRNKKLHTRRKEHVD